jgi:hypothetical protein
VAISLAILSANRKIAWISGAVALVLTAAVKLPVLGVPLAFAGAAYALIRVSKPYAVARGRTLSPRQQHRAAAIAATAILGVGVMFAGALYAVGLARALEHRLQESLKAAHRRGELKPGQLVEECTLACARAVVIEIPAYNTPGIAKLNGYTVHDHLIYQWRSPAAPSDTNTAVAAPR